MTDERCIHGKDLWDLCTECPVKPVAEVVTPKVEVCIHNRSMLSPCPHCEAAEVVTPKLYACCGYCERKWLAASESEACPVCIDVPFEQKGKPRFDPMAETTDSSVAPTTHSPFYAAQEKWLTDNGFTEISESSSEAFTAGWNAAKEMTTPKPEHPHPIFDGKFAEAFADPQEFEEWRETPEFRNAAIGLYVEELDVDSVSDFAQSVWNAARKSPSINQEMRDGLVKVRNHLISGDPQAALEVVLRVLSKATGDSK